MPEPASQEPASQSVFVHPEPVTPGSEIKDTSFAIPEAFKDKPYLKDVKSYEDVFTKLDGAQKLVGQRPAGVPENEASQEEWDKFYKTVGRPESADKYEFKKEENAETHEGFEKGIKGLFHKAGLNQKQASTIQEGYDSLIKDISKELMPDQEQQDKEFSDMTVKIFGDKQDIILEDVKKLIDENKPEGSEFQKHLGNLPNESLVIMSAVINNIKNKYIGEDRVTQGTGQGTTVSDLQAEGVKIMSSNEWKNPATVSSEAHQKATNRVNEIYRTISKLKNTQTT